MNIAEIIPQDNYILYVRSEDGKAGLFDVKPYLESEVFMPLKNRSEFEQIHNGRFFVEWNCGADLSAHHSGSLDNYLGESLNCK